MKTVLLTNASLALGFLGLALALVVWQPLPAAEDPGTADNKIYDYVRQHWQEMLQVTKSPHHVQPWGTELCRAPFPIQHDPHAPYWIHVLVSPGGTNAMLTGKGSYPQDTIILKQKLAEPGSTKVSLYTGMRKRERGYNPELNDWEFFTLDSRYMVTARGKIESCMNCHRNYKSTDYVARSYLTDKEDVRKPSR